MNVFHRHQVSQPMFFVQSSSGIV